MVNFIRNESNSSGSDNEDFILEARFGRKREREVSEADEAEGTSHKRIRRISKDDGDFYVRKETQAFQRSIFTSSSISQPKRFGALASSLAADFCIPGSPYPGLETSSDGSSTVSGLSKMFTSEKAEVVSDVEPAILTPPSSPRRVSASSNSSSAYTSPVAFAALAHMESSVFVKPAASARKVCPPTPRKSLISSKKGGQNSLPIYFQNALQYHSSLELVFNQDLRILGVAERPGRQDALLGAGEFVNAYSIRFKANAEAKESVQVLKIHHFKRHIRSPDQLIDCIVSEIKQYIFLQNKGFPVVDFFTFDEFLDQRNNSTPEKLHENQQAVLNQSVVETGGNSNRLDDQEVKVLPAIPLNRVLYEDVKQSTKVLKAHLRDNFLHPFYRVEYVPYSIADTKEMFESRYEGEIASSKGDPELLEKLLNAQNDPLCQVKKMFEFAWNEHVCLDLCLGNLRIRKEGKVVLIDLYYDRKEQFDWHLTNCLRTFVNDINSPLLDYLISGLPEEAKKKLADIRKEG